MNLYNQTTGKKIETVRQARASVARRTRSANDARRKLEELKAQQRVYISH